MSTKAENWDDRVSAWTAKLPERPRAMLDWLRQPSRWWLRIFAALLFIVGGLLSILPILGLWMLPIGLALLSQDVPIIKVPLERTACGIERAWTWITVRWRR